MADYAKRAGFPDTTGRRKIVLAAALDSLGSGFFLPFSFVYFTQGKSLPVVTVGTLLSSAAFLSLIGNIAAGPLVDRIGAQKVIVASNVVRAFAFAGYLVCDRMLTLFLLVLLNNIGESFFWPANNVLISLVSKTGETAQWFAMERSLRNGGIGLGGILAAVATSLRGHGAFDVIIVANVISFLGAGVLLATVYVPGPPAAESTPVTGRDPGGKIAGGYRGVLKDGRFIALCACNVLLALTDFVLTILLPEVFSTRSEVAWMAGMFISLNTFLVMIGMPISVRLMEKRSHVSILKFASFLYAVSFIGMAIGSSGPTWVLIILTLGGVAIFTAAEIIQAPSVFAMASELSEAQSRGRYMSVFQLSFSIAVMAAPALIAVLLSHGTVAPWLVLTLGVIVVYAVIGRLHSRPVGELVKGNR
ncbi:MAG TPA: MFS transporter [Streptomyces sp.]